jgi:peptidoglycan/LPS O-acetylase OafA/YrhL
MVVFLSHACRIGIAGNILPNLIWQGTNAVTVFFVLSGFVVAHAAQTKDRDLAAYAVSRLARLWSVALPSIVLSAVLLYLGNRYGRGLVYGSIVPDSFMTFDQVRQAVQSNGLLRALIGALFLNEIWSFSVVQFGNAPYWSLGYEFWYYALFGAYFYLRGHLRLLAVCGIALMVGPKILLLLPVWLTGVLIYHLRPGMPRWLAGFCVVAPAVAYVLLSYVGAPRLAFYLDADLPFDAGWSTPFAWDYVLGLLAGVNFLGFSALRGTWILHFRVPIRFLAGNTLSLYLFHFPILYFLAAVAPNNGWPIARAVTIIVITLLSVWLLSTVTEAQKNRWRGLVETMLFGWRRWTRSSAKPVISSEVPLLVAPEGSTDQAS